jgi:hypothetical protein
LLTPGVAGAVSRVTGWKHSHGRVRLVSPPSLWLMMRRAGFRRLRIRARGRGHERRAPRAAFARYYAIVGRKP